jgi:hypothetical protein
MADMQDYENGDSQMQQDNDYNGQDDSENHQNGNSEPSGRDDDR